MHLIEPWIIICIAKTAPFQRFIIIIHTNNPSLKKKKKKNSSSIILGDDKSFSKTLGRVSSGMTLWSVQVQRTVRRWPLWSVYSCSPTVAKEHPTVSGVWSLCLFKVFWGGPPVRSVPRSSKSKRSLSGSRWWRLPGLKCCARLAPGKSEHHSSRAQDKKNKTPKQIRGDGWASSRTFQFPLRNIWKTIELMQSKINIPRLHQGKMWSVCDL